MLRTLNRVLAKRSKKSVRNLFYFNKIYFTRISFLYENFRQKKEKGLVCETSEPIQPLGLKFSSLYKDVLKEMDKPSYVYDNEQNEHNHKVLLIRETVSNISLLVQLQFYNQKLFFIALHISKNTYVEKVDVINTVMQKYLNKPYKLGDEYPIIQDPSGNFVIINDDVSFSICYFDSGYSEFQKNINRPKESSSPVERSKKEKESMFYAF